MRSGGSAETGRKSVKMNKWSMKHFVFDQLKDGKDNFIGIVILPVLQAGGVRKVKNISIRVSVFMVNQGVVTVDTPCTWALIYVPQGFTPHTLADGEWDRITPNYGYTSDIYSPVSHVILTGLADKLSGNFVCFSPLARNLNEGDTIVLIIRTGDVEYNQARYFVEGGYSICFS
jgi:hypothetical protein